MRVHSAVGHRHDREPRHSDERKRRERAVRLDFRERYRARQLLVGDDVHDKQLAGRILRVRIRIGARVGDGDATAFCFPVW